MIGYSKNFLLDIRAEETQCGLFGTDSGAGKKITILDCSLIIDAGQATSAFFVSFCDVINKDEKVLKIS